MEEINYPNNVGSPEDPTVELEQDDVASLEVAKRSLVGRILSDKIQNKGDVKSMLTK
ncbi:hypothetical protein A2U01_0072725, partial [Trifolium medium]|nr:hypothetical protein [Trifolium medium]